MFSGRSMAEPRADQAFELIEAGGAESRCECDDHLAASAVIVGREQIEDFRGQHLRIALGDCGPGPPAVGNGFGDGVADHAVRVIGPLEDVRVEPDQTLEQLSSGARVDGEKLRGDPLPDPVELVGKGAAFAVAIESPIHPDGVDLACQGVDERITRSRSRQRDPHRLEQSLVPIAMLDHDLGKSPSPEAFNLLGRKFLVACPRRCHRLPGLTRMNPEEPIDCSLSPRKML